jgi:hypothetical protein
VPDGTKETTQVEAQGGPQSLHRSSGAHSACGLRPSTARSR